MKTFLSPLSQEKERDCLMRLKQGDLKAKEELILHNMRLVAHIVKKYAPTPDGQEELISIGTVGLIKAVTTFDHTKGNRFSAYGSRCVENEILMHYRKEKKTKPTEFYLDIHLRPH